MIVSEELIQGSREWIDARLGVLTASQVKELVTPTGKLSSQRSKLLHRLVAETALHEPVETWGGNYWTERGSENEFEASAYFALQTGLTPHAVGFVWKDSKKTCGCSPDWLIKGEDGEWCAGAEVKNPAPATHVGYLLEDGEQYTQQVQFSLWVTGLPIWYFMSYHERLPPLLKTVTPDEKWQESFDKHVPVFISELAEAKEKVRSMMADGVEVFDDRGTGEDELPLGF